MGTEREGDIGTVDPAELPTSDIEVEAHVHFAMAGSFPLRMAELFFSPRGLYIAEYSYITPLFGLGTNKHRKDAAAMRALYDKYGIDAVFFHADRILWLNYGLLDRVVLYTGGWIGRPKVTIYAADGASYAYRLLDDRSFDAVTADVAAAAEDHDVVVTIHDRLGLDPRENIVRFFHRE